VRVAENRAESVPDRHRSSIEGLFSSLGGLNRPAKPRPVEKWNPPFCGDLDMRIASDGTWFYLGTPIGRLALVKLFASILRKDPDRYVLVTPVERVGITVEDAPFQAVEMVAAAKDGHDVLNFRTNVDDVVAAGREHSLRFEGGVRTGLKPYVHVRGDLWARLTRPLLYDLVERGEERMLDGVATLGVTSGGVFFPMAPARDIQDIA
jgi:hypothetical protein